MVAKGLALLFPAALFLLLPALALAPQRDALLRQPASKDLPNIILIGIDSLRPDHLSGAGAPESFTPTIDSFIAQAVVFDHAHTPMGRTFVALMSVISGQYPIRHGARENLYPRSLVRTDDLLTSRLQKNGYTTIFSIDDVRFANIDQSFGFDRVASPQPGVVEILASTVSNTAGTNLIQLLPGAHILLPHTAANRAIPSSYAPHLYARRLSRHIHATPTESPLFLLAHFTLPHSPFALGSWRNEHLSAAYVDSPASYRKALAMADAQVQDVLTLLRNAGRLDNALVVLFSDHGEGLGMKKDRWKVSSSLRDGVAPSDFGHGGTAVDDSQNRILISLQRYEGGTAVWQHARTPGAASLVDISPTVTQVTGIAVDPNQFDGTSLVSYDGAPAIHKSRPVFVESGIFGGSLRALHPDPASVINEFAHVYRVTPDLRAELKQEHLPTLLRDKERGVIYDGFAVAATPTLDGEGCWTKAAYAQRTIDCFNSRHLDPVVLQYSSLVCTHFVEDVDFFRQWCVANVHSEATISP